MNWSIARAQCWEFTRLARRDYLTMTWILLLIVPALHGLMHSTMAPAETEVVYPLMLSIIYSVLLLVMCLPQMSHSASGTCSLGDSSATDYSRPITTAQMMFVPIFLSLVTRLAYYLAVLYLAGKFLGYHFPVAGGVILIGSLHIALRSMELGCSRVSQVLLALACMVAVTLYVLMPNLNLLGAILLRPEQWSQLLSFSPVDSAVLTLVACLSLVLGWWMGDGKRHGDTGGDQQALRRRIPKPSGSRKLSSPFQSAIRAQWWLEFRRALRATGVNTLVIVPLLIIATLVLPYLGMEANGLLTLWVLVFLSCPVVFVVMATESVSAMPLRAKDRELSIFERTQPLTVECSLVIKVGAAMTTSLLCTLLTYAVGAIVVWILRPALTEAHAELIRFAEERLTANLSWATITLVAVVFLLALGVTLSLLALVSRYLLHARAFGPVASLFAGTLVPAFYGLLLILDKRTDWNIGIVWAAHAWILAAAILFGTIWGLRRVREAGLVHVRSQFIALMAWILFVGASLWLKSSFASIGLAWANVENVHMLALCVGLLCLPLGSVAWAPLALSAQRSQ